MCEMIWMDCVLCGERRDIGSEYCWRCRQGACPHCGFVHDRSPCDPSLDVP
jgi:hypothetical protein